MRVKYVSRVKHVTGKTDYISNNNNDKTVYIKS